MPQLSLYITDENFEVLRARSKEAGLSLSKYANKLIEQDATSGGWPAGFWSLYGAIDDETFLAPDDAPPADDAFFEKQFD